MIRKIYKSLLPVLLIIAAIPAVTGQSADQIIWSVNWSPDDRLIVAGGADQVLRIYDGNSYDLIRNDTFDVWIHRLRWHPSKNILAVAANGNGSRLINFDEAYQISLDGLEGAGTRAIDWNTKGDKLAIADYEGFIHIYDQDGTVINVFSKENSRSFTGIAWHPKEDRLLVIGEYVREYTMDGKLLLKYLHRPKKVLLLSVAWHPSGAFYVIGDYGIPEENISPAVQFYDQNHKMIRQLKGSLAEYRNVAWSPDGEKLATSGDALRIWSKNGYLLFESIPEDDNLWGVDWNSDGTKIVTSSEKGHIKVWDAKAKLIKTLR